MSERRIPGALLGWVAFVVIFSVLNYAVRFSGSRPPRDVAYRYESAVAALLQFAIVFGIVLLLARGRDRRSLLGLRPPSSWKTAVVISIGIILLIVAVAIALSPFVNAEKEQGLTPTYWDSERIGQFAAFALAVVVIGPIVEELAFRGAGFGLLEPYGQWSAVIVVGIAFGLAHGLLQGLPIITSFGLGLAYLRSRTGSIYPCVLLHAGFNATALGLGIAT